MTTSYPMVADQWKRADESLRQLVYHPGGSSLPEHVHGREEPEDRWIDQYYVISSHPRGQVEHQLDLELEDQDIKRSFHTLNQAGEILSENLRQSFARSHLQMAVASLGQQLSSVSRDIQKIREVTMSLAGAVNGLYDRIESLEATVESPGIATTEAPAIDWGSVGDHVKEVATQLGWEVTLESDPQHEELIVQTPASQSDLVAETSLEFYTALAERLDSDTYEQVGFVFDSSSE